MVKVTLIDLNDCQVGNCLPIKFSLYCPDLLGSQARPGLQPSCTSARQASQPALTTAPQSRTARPTSGGHELQPDPERRQQPRSRGCPALLAGSTQGSQARNCLAAAPAWRTTAVAQDGLCRETAPPTRTEDSWEKMSFSHRNFAASRLRLNP